MRRPRNTSPLPRIRTMPTLARKPSESMTSFMGPFGEVCHIRACGEQARAFRLARPWPIEREPVDVEKSCPTTGHVDTHRRPAGPGHDRVLRIAYVRKL